ncbi:dihydropyrimidinase [Mesorhizobium sp. WSM4976]|uniref:dihydropyrimidinase n=1 Tax=Mesorhizobium sp. WSM4976 TaxID=3038549 RepID=UPI002417FB11|nr:dihydropyrimidinase [Mesorhizobium sp. WSM4976]MDG4892757.1 dihydropyrimidinase [Mesorhizobium sp. WSM4976]
MPLDMIIKGGTVVTATDRFRSDIGIEDGRIFVLARNLEGAPEVIDASGLLVIPGGIDSHVHLDQPGSPGIVMADNFETGTRSAAVGGNTTVLPFCLQAKGQTLREAITEYERKAEGNCHVDVAFHLIISDPTPQVLGQELPALIEEGYTSIKIFMTYDDLVLRDRDILEVLAVARRHGALVMVHAEGYDTIKFLTDQLERQGNTAPFFHGPSRPVVVEREATHRAISLAELVDTDIMIVHVSNRQAMEEIRRAQQRGLAIYGETCPQYLVLTENDMDRAGMEGAKYVCSPPPRDVDSQLACWEGLQQGVFEVFSSDHCPFRYEDEAGKNNAKGRRSFRYVPNGIPGIAARMPILFSEGVSKGRISLNRFVALTSTNHAKRYGLYPQKGTIAVGADADLVLWDDKKKVTLTHDLLQDGCDYTPYEGMEVTGWPVRTIMKGRTIVVDGVVSESRIGTQLKRTLPRLKTY